MQNTWSIGTFYIKPNGPNGYWTQPGGPGTTVFPQQVRANSDQLSIEPYSELTGTYMGSCNHSFNQCAVYTDWDYDTSMSVALICCPICSVVFRTIEPASDALGPSNAATLLNSILFP
jgi:hypothetical protein